jgi:HlyD family secretion protein
MRRVAPFILIALVITAFMFKDRWLSPLGGEAHYLGYVEGETTLISSPIAGRLVARAVNRGEQVKGGAMLFRIDPTVADAEVQRLAATVAETKAQLENIQTGKREIEQDIIRAQLREAEAGLKLAEQDLERSSQLVRTGAVTRARYDQAVSQVEQMRAKVQQMRAQEKAGDLGGRVREIEAANAKVVEAQASLAQAVSRQADLAPTAPAAALVENTYFDVGEWVAAGQPVLALLTPENLKLRFFVPEDQVARAHPGAAITFGCDGCGAKLKATISYVSPRAEFTPPVIYSESARRKLVFLVEAKPAEANSALRTGLPVEVDQLTAGKP